MANSVFYTFLLSQILGLYMLIFSILMLSRVKFFRGFIKQLKANDSVLVVGSAFGLLIGLALVDTHNIWVFGPNGVITVICWLILIKSILWLSMTDEMLAWTKKIFAGAGYYLVTFVMLFFGLLLASRGLLLFVRYQIMPLVAHS